MGEIINIDGIKIPIGSHEGKTIVIGSDHRGFDYKKQIIVALESYDLMDVGTVSTEKCDYPRISDSIGRLVSEAPYTRVGIGICGSGIGILIPASKHQGVYVARCLTAAEAETSRIHNNTNFLGIGADCVDLETALETINTWLTTPFGSDREAEKAYLQRFVQTVKLETAVRRL